MNTNRITWTLYGMEILRDHLAHTIANTNILNAGLQGMEKLGLKLSKSLDKLVESAEDEDLRQQAHIEFMSSALELLEETKVRLKTGNFVHKEPLESCLNISSFMVENGLTLFDKRPSWDGR